MDKIGEWKVVGRNRKVHGERGSAQREERWCAGRSRKKKKKDRYLWVWSEKVFLFYFIYV